VSSIPVALELDGVGRIVDGMNDNAVEEPSVTGPVSVVSNANLLQFLQRHCLDHELVHLVVVGAQHFYVLYRQKRTP